MLTLKKLGIYWNPSIQTMISDLSKEKSIEILKSIVKGSTIAEYVISVTGKAYLTIKNKNDPKSANLPEQGVGLSVDPINIQLKKLQLQQIINLLEFFTGYQRFTLKNMKKRQEEIKHISKEQSLQNKEKFKILFNKLQRSEKKDEFKEEEKLKACLSNEEEVQNFRNLLLVLPDELLASAIKDVLKEIEQDVKLKALREEEAKKNKSLWGWFKGSSTEKKDEAQVNAEEMQKLEQYLNEVFSEQEGSTSIENQLEEAAYKKNLVIEFELKGGSIYLSDVVPGCNEEGVNFYYEGLNCSIEVNNKGKAANLSLKEIVLSLKTKYAGTNSYILTPIIQRQEYVLGKKSTSPILLIDFALNPKGKDEGTYIQLNARTLEIVYRPQAIERLTNFFNVKAEDEALRSKALEITEKAQEKAKLAANEALQANTKISLSVIVAAPNIIVPFLQNGDVRGECWVLNMGNLQIMTFSAETEEDKACDLYKIILRNTKFQYFPSQLLYMNMLKSRLEKDDLSLLTEEELADVLKIYDLIEEISIGLSIKMKQAVFNENDQFKHIPGIEIELAIPSINMKLKPQILNNLLKLQVALNYSIENSQDLVETERSILVSGCYKMGIIYLKEKKFNGEYEWNKYFVIFKGAYLHFLKKQTDARSSSSIYIKNSKIYQLNNDAEKPFSFMVKPVKFSDFNLNRSKINITQ